MSTYRPKTPHTLEGVVMNARRMSPKVTEWLDEMTRPENNKDFCDWAQSKGMCDRQMAIQETRKGHKAKDPNPSFYGHKFTQVQP